MDISTKIIESCKRADNQACKQLYDFYKELSYGICLRYAESTFDADDIFQEAWIKVFRDISQFRGEGSIEGWIKRIMVNTSLTFLTNKRKLGFSAESEIPEEEVYDISFDEIQMQNDQQKMIMEMIHKLPTGYRTVLNLYILEDLTHEQIANQLSISINTSKTQLMRAKKLLKKMLDSVFIN